DLVRAELADLAPAEQRPALPLRLVAALLVAAAPAPAAAPALSEWHLDLHSVKPIVVVIEIVDLGLPSLAGLPLRRATALDTPALGIGLPLGPRPVHDLLFLID